jgi:hypothetical protein
MNNRRATGPPEPDWISRLVRDRPGTVAPLAMLSWLVLGAVVAAERWSGVGWRIWAILAFPAFVLTGSASVSLFLRDPEWAGPDALRGGLIAAGALALGVGRAAVRAFGDAGAGRIALVCMASATIGGVVGAMAGPVAGWGLRSASRAARALICGHRGR